MAETKHALRSYWWLCQTAELELGRQVEGHRAAGWTEDQGIPNPEIQAERIECCLACLFDAFASAPKLRQEATKSSASQSLQSVVAVVLLAVRRS